MATNKNGKPAFIASAELIENLNKNSDSFNGAVNQTLERYFDIIKTGRREVRKTFTDNELMLIADICNGTMFEPFGMILENNGVLMQYEDTKDIYGEQFNEKWQVEDLTEKLENLSKLGQIGLIDVVESFWNGKYASVADVFKKS